jgi:hypothetical protein
MLPVGMQDGLHRDGRWAEPWSVSSHICLPTCRLAAEEVEAARRSNGGGYVRCEWCPTWYLVPPDPIVHRVNDDDRSSA